MAHSCKPDINQVFSSLQNPATQPDFLTPGYEPPAESFGGSWSIKIFFDGTAYEFVHFYGDNHDMRIESNFGQRGMASFSITDPHKELSILPFIPVNEQYIEIWNSTSTHQYFAGFLRDVDSRLLSVRDDLSEASEYMITATDLYHELERRSITDIYLGKKIGFILKDVITRYTTLDASEIDATAGFTIDSYPISAKTPSQVVTHLVDLLGQTTYMIDGATRKFKLLDTDAGGAKFNTAINDSNLYDYFDRDNFSLRRQTDSIQNEIELHFNLRYTAGTVNVANASTIVAGFGSPPVTDWDDLPADIRFKLASSDAIYTVNKNLSSGATQELRLSSAYQEATATDQAYELIGHRTRIRVSDGESQGVMARVRGDDGRFVFVVSEDNNNFTYSEARRFASALLSLSQPLPKGQGTTFNTVFQDLPLTAGKVLPFALQQSRRYVGDVIVQQIILSDLGGELEADEHASGQPQPNLKIDMVFTATLNSRQAQMRKVMMDLRKVKVNIDDENIQRYAQLRETMVWSDCVHAHRPVTLTDLLDISDLLVARDVDDTPLFYTEMAYTLGPVDYSFTTS